MKSNHLPGSVQLRTFYVVTFLTIFIGQCHSQFRPPQVEITDTDTVGYSFVSRDSNIISLSGTLNPFFEKMMAQRTGGGRKISIVHIGDSHILGNFLTQEVRSRLQREFGDAGRGFVFPYKLAGTNGPRDYLVETNCRWTGSNCQRNLAAETNYGISGFRLETNSSNGELTLRLRDTTTSETKLFSKLTIFQTKDPENFELDVRDVSSAQTAHLYLEDDYSRSYFFDKPVAQATVSARKTDGIQTRMVIDGISLENELSGVIYHSIGVNGAKFMDFARARYFARQVAALEPDLIIFSFGTNEGQGNTPAEYLLFTMNTLINKVKEHSPAARIMLTTPADSYLRGKGFNPFLSDVSRNIRQFASEKGYALWDLYQITGGEKSAADWKSGGLMSSDSVHYSKAGYAVQGKLLYQSIIRAYNAFAESKQ
jgi:lysophospholipase L1-like esterase